MSECVVIRARKRVQMKLVAVLVEGRSDAQGVRVCDQPLGVYDTVVECVEAAIRKVGSVDDHVCASARQRRECLCVCGARSKSVGELLPLRVCRSVREGVRVCDQPLLA